METSSICIGNPETEPAKAVDEALQQLKKKIAALKTHFQKRRHEIDSEAEMRDKMSRAKTTEISRLQTELQNVTQENEVLNNQFEDHDM